MKFTLSVLTAFLLSGTTTYATDPTQLLYNGRCGVQSDQNGLLYMRARYYAPSIDRFINQDTLLGEINPGASLNRFAFCNGDPVNNFDPDGRCAEGLQSGLSGTISPNAPTSPAFYAANLVGGYLSGAGSGVQNGAGGDVNALSLENVQGAFGSDSTSSEYAMGRNITYGGMATVAVVGTGGVAGSAVLGAMEGSVATGALTESGVFVSSVPAAGNAAANFLSGTSSLLAPGGSQVAAYSIANSSSAIAWGAAALSAAGFSTKNPITDYRGLIGKSLNDQRLQLINALSK